MFDRGRLFESDYLLKFARDERLVEAAEKVNKLCAIKNAINLLMQPRLPKRDIIRPDNRIACLIQQQHTKFGAAETLIAEVPCKGEKYSIVVLCAQVADRSSNQIRFNYIRNL